MRIRIISLFFLAVSALATLGGCGSRPQGSGLSNEAVEPADRFWLAKSVRLLRGGAGISADESVDALAALGPDGVIDTMMGDPRFGDMVLDFNLYFLGFKPASIRRSESWASSPYVDEVYAKPQALTAAAEVLRDGDYLKLFDPDVSRLVRPSNDKPRGEDLPEEDRESYPENGPPKAQRSYILGVVERLVGEAIPALAKVEAGDQSIDEACDEVSDKIETATMLLFSAGLAEEANEWIREPVGNVFVSCFLRAPLPPGSIPALRTIPDRIAAVVEKAEEWNADIYKVKYVTDLKPFAENGEPGSLTSSFTFEGFWEAFQNSSTNYNRRRAAYMLRTYFCDDLTPINIAISTNPSDHTKNRHASDPGCRGCHYKLDPMAGFFRDRGISGVSFEGSDTLMFDDMARIDGDTRRRYLDSWRAEPEAGRIWEVGYIRHPTKPQRNSYGESLSDLFKIIKTAPETRACLVRRLAEYTLGTEQAFDQAWLDELGKQFDTETNSSKAFKNVVRTLIKSKTFTVRDPDPEVCYDEITEMASPGMPCEIRAIVEKHCAGCHSSTDADHGLDLTGWINLPGGGQSFPHVDGSGTQRTLQDSLSRIRARLEGKDPDIQDGANSSDPAKLMPPGGGRITDPEKQRLYKWIEKRLTDSGA